MEAFTVRDKLIRDSLAFTAGAVEIRNRGIAAHVSTLLDRGAQWPYPWLRLNPDFATGDTISDILFDGVPHPESEPIFRLTQDEHDCFSCGGAS